MKTQVVFQLSVWERDVVFDHLPNGRLFVLSESVEDLTEHTKVFIKINKSRAQELNEPVHTINPAPNRLVRQVSLLPGLICDFAKDEQ